jgi:Zn-dependent membrane protease YugP
MVLIVWLIKIIKNNYKRYENRINPIGLKGNEINERMKTLMGISTLNENKSNIVVELTKLGPDNKVYAIIRENHEYYIKSTDKVSNISEDFKYIGGLQNKKQEVHMLKLLNS